MDKDYELDEPWAKKPLNEMSRDELIQMIGLLGSQLARARRAANQAELFWRAEPA